MWSLPHGWKLGKKFLVQWLGLYLPAARGMGSIRLNQGTKIPQGLCPPRPQKGGQGLGSSVTWGSGTFCCQSAEAEVQSGVPGSLDPALQPCLRPQPLLGAQDSPGAMALGPLCCSS